MRNSAVQPSESTLRRALPHGIERRVAVEVVALHAERVELEPDARLPVVVRVEHDGDLVGRSRCRSSSWSRRTSSARTPAAPASRTCARRRRGRRRRRGCAPRCAASAGRLVGRLLAEAGDRRRGRPRRLVEPSVDGHVADALARARHGTRVVLGRAHGRRGGRGGRRGRGNGLRREDSGPRERQGQRQQRERGRDGAPRGEARGERRHRRTRAGGRAPATGPVPRETASALRRFADLPASLQRVTLRFGVRLPRRARAVSVPGPDQRSGVTCIRSGRS